jgi:hypothetical protein
VHIECEEARPDGIKFGKNADLTKITYYCTKCRQNTSNNKSSNKKLPVIYSDASVCDGGSKEEGQAPAQGHKKSSGDQLDCIALLGARYFWKQKEFNFPYFYSENYQTVEKLVTNLGKNIGLSEEEFNNDFLSIYEEIGDQDLISEQYLCDKLKKLDKKLSGLSKARRWLIMERLAR